MQIEHLLYYYFYFIFQVAKLKTKVPEYSEAAFENLQEELVLIVLVDTKSHFDVELQVIQVNLEVGGSLFSFCLL